LERWVVLEGCELAHKRVRESRAVVKVVVSASLKETIKGSRNPFNGVLRPLVFHPCFDVVHELHRRVVKQNKISIENLTLDLDRSSLLRFGERQDIEGRVG